MVIDPSLQAVFESLDKHNNPVLARAKDGEPIFVIRATDALAINVIDYWCESLRAVSGASAVAATPDEKIKKAQRVRSAINEWQIIHGSKVPD